MKAKATSGASASGLGRPRSKASAPRCTLVQPTSPENWRSSRSSGAKPSGDRWLVASQLEVVLAGRERLGGVGGRARARRGCHWPSARRLVTAVVRARTEREQGDDEQQPDPHALDARSGASARRQVRCRVETGSSAARVPTLSVSAEGPSPRRAAYAVRERRQGRRVDPPALPVQVDVVVGPAAERDQPAGLEVGEQLGLGQHPPAQSEADRLVEVGAGRDQVHGVRLGHAARRAGRRAAASSLALKTTTGIRCQSWPRPLRQRSASSGLAAGR